jgi:hypothetical protein
LAAAHLAKVADQFQEKLKLWFLSHLDPHLRAEAREKPSEMDLE